MQDTRHKLNAPAAIAEEVEGEVIAINLSTGTYFSMQGWSIWAWNGLVSGCSASSLRAALEAAAGAGAAGSFDRFLADLLAERLVVPADDGGLQPSPPDLPDTTFDGLRLERYTDMADLILLDPVHDVGAAGWPRAAETDSGV